MATDVIKIINHNHSNWKLNFYLRKKEICGDGVFKSELGEFFEREIGEDGYVGLDVRVTASRTDVVLKTTAPQKVLGEKGRRIRELTSLVEKRFGFKEGGIELYADRVERRSLSAASQAESIKFKLLAGLPVRRACYGAMRFAMEGGARGIEITVAGKLRGQRARGVKFRDGYMLKAGKPAEDMVDIAVRHIMMKQGMFGVKVRIMQPYDPEGKIGVSVEQPDVITVFPPKEDSKDIGKHAQDLPVISGKN
ncbi:40S ribosomal protein S3-RELATED [Anaeramoeba flamelloides]|uniref:Small ribosomal subunit protein uS3 n=1 Tax=Anaeramoeba flamelloides TaxID=1746091 RepID=A0AAV8ADD5_9EUKA|nr:40S ribosomal protein S3-RELATED [Anaeramoeba flamelloides]